MIYHYGMVRIGLCDDEEPELGNLRSLVADYARERRLAFDVACFGSGEDLLLAIGKGRGFDVIFLDVYMGLQNGVDVARELRQTDPACSIIFATNSRDHAIDGYGVHALQYLLKPLCRDNVWKALDQAMDAIERAKDRFVQLQNRVGLYKIPLSDIVYAESEARVVTVHTGRQGDLEFYLRLDEFERLCGDPRFLRCHKSFLVNLDYVYAVTGRCLVLDDGREIRFSMSAQAAKSVFAAHAARNI